jgi:hypothetical protein
MDTEAREKHSLRGFKNGVAYCVTKMGLANLPGLQAKKRRVSYATTPTKNTGTNSSRGLIGIMDPTLLSTLVQ